MEKQQVDETRSPRWQEIKVNKKDEPYIVHKRRRYYMKDCMRFGHPGHKTVELVSPAGKILMKAQGMISLGYHGLCIEINDREQKARAMFA